jgi:BASS family bile acid:Na+ symporter
MLHVLVTYAVPLNLVLLMIVAGTEIQRSAFSTYNPLKPVLVGSLGQLVFLPPIALAVISFVKPNEVVAAALVILALCPGGGISNAYCYLARCNVLLSALITAAGTLFCLFTIPIWFMALSYFPGVEHRVAAIPAGAVLGQLAAFMIAPLIIGATAKEMAPQFVERASLMLRTLSLGLVAFILAVALATVASQFVELFFDITITAVLFILAALLLGAALGRPFNTEVRYVIAIESCVRNIALALVLGSIVLKDDNFAVLATFLAGYLAAEIAIMLPFVALAARAKASHSITVRP